MSDWRLHRVLGLTYGELAWMAIGCLALAYEIWAVFTHGGDVLTRAMRANTSRWTAIPVGLGGLMGHLTGPSWSLWPYAWVAPFAMLATALARDFFAGGPIPGQYVPLLFLSSYALGTLWVGSP